MLTIPSILPYKFHFLLFVVTNAFSGSMPGPTAGTMGDMSGATPVAMSGAMPGTMSGPMPGTMSGPMPGAGAQFISPHMPTTTQFKPDFRQRNQPFFQQQPQFQHGSLDSEVCWTKAQ